MPNKKSFFLRILLLRSKYFTDKQFVLIMSIIVGFLAGLGAVTLKNITYLIQGLLKTDFIHEYQELYFFAFPIIGLAITYLMIKYVIRNKVSHGIPTTLYAISKKKGILKRYQMFGSILTAPITIGFGGSVGLEGPTVSTGAAISSNVSRLFHLNQKQRYLLIGCAAVGALSSIFKAPIAAIIFAIEVFSLDLTLTSMLPLLLASISAILTSYLFFGQGLLLAFDKVDVFTLDKVPYYIILGIVSGLISIYFTFIYDKVHKIFDTILSPWKKILLGGSLLAIMIFMMPPLYGEGFHVINHLIEGEPEKILKNMFFDIGHQDTMLILLFLAGLVFCKIIASSITFGAGGVGGIFAPTLFMGSAMGYCVSKAINALGFFNINLSENNFVLVGMAGLLAGVLHAPLTAIFLIAELTGGYDLFVPLMLTSAIAFAISKAYSPHSVYTMELGRKGDLITHDKDHAVLTLMEVEKVMESNFTTIDAKMSLGEIVHNAVTKSTRNIYPVIDSENEAFLGIILLDDIRNIMFRTELYEKVFVSDIMHAAPAIINLDHDKMTVIMKKFEDSAAWNLPVIKGNKYQGFISKSKLLTVYRRKLIEVSN